MANMFKNNYNFIYNFIFNYTRFPEKLIDLIIIHR